MPASIKRIEASAFNNCASLETVEFVEGTNIEYIGNSAFSGCKALKEITLYTNEIGNSAFYGCESLVNVTFAGNTSTEAGNIGEYAFSGCKTLSNVTFEKDSNVGTIGKFAFSSCVALKEIEIPGSVTTIGDYVFNQSAGLETITFASDSTIDKIGQYTFAFNNQYNSTKTYPSYKKIVLPASIKNIEYQAFYNCALLENVEFAEGSNLEAIGAEAFYGCKALQEITLYTNEIGDYAFYNCESLASVTFENNTSTEAGSIGERAFDGCKELSEITFAEGYKVGEIGRYAFSSCAKLKEFEIPAGVTTLGNYIFNQCTALETITFAENSVIETIGSYTFAFHNQYTSNKTYPSIKKIVLPASVKTISASAFTKFASLESVEFAEGSNLETIESSAFSECIALKEIVLPDSLKTISSYAFESSGLDSVIIGANVTYIGEYAFSYIGSFKGNEGIVVKIKIEADSISGISNYAFVTGQYVSKRNVTFYAIENVQEQLKLLEIGNATWTYESLENWTE